MVIVKLMGGLASQMHKYALARAIALRGSARVKVDLTPLTNPLPTDTVYTYVLDRLRTHCDIATPAEIGLFKQSPFLMRFKRGMKRFFGINLFHPGYQNASFISLAEFQAIRPPCYIEGEYIGAAYFQDIRETLIGDFELKKGFSEEAAVFQRQILDSVAVSIHFRRGDFLSNPHAQKAHAICSPEYYHQAIKMILEREPRATFFVFSDEIPWVKDNFKPGVPLHFVSGLPEYEEFTLMRLCRHNIIANSGFSWFSSWLNQNPGKIIVAPTTWQKDPAVNTMFLNALQSPEMIMLDNQR
jgi:hypothetical protein